VTAKFVTQLVAPDTASAAPRIRLGNISPRSTHITGPHEIANATMYRLAAARHRHRGPVAEERLSVGADSRHCEYGGQHGQGHRHAGRAHEQQRFCGSARSMSAMAGIVARMLTRPVSRLIRRAHCSVAPAAFHSTSP